MFIIADPLSQNVSGTGTYLYYPCFVSSVLMYLCCSASVLPFQQFHDGKIRVPFIHRVAQEDTFQGD